jgi:O-antigen biosynthesis protein
MTPRRVTIVASELLGRPATGGAGTADSLLAVALGRHGHRVELLVASGREIGRLNNRWEGIYASAGVEVRVLERMSGVRPPFLAPAYEVFRALRDRPPEVAIANDWRGLAYFALQARGLGLAFGDTAFVVHCHGPGRVLTEFAQKVPDTLARFGEHVTERASVALADAVVSPSAWLLDWMRARGWPVRKDARVIQYLRQSVVLDEPPVQAPTGHPVSRLAFFGQIREGKGVRIFLAALAALEPELLDDVEVAFLGSESARWTKERVRAAISPRVRERLAAVEVLSSLEREAALEELRRPGTLAVMPSLLDNSPNTVAECIEQGIPFVTTRTGGIPELVAENDRDRVLCRPAADDLAAALARALTARAFAPARPAEDPAASLAAWLDLVESVAPRRRLPGVEAKRVALVAGGPGSERRAHRLAERTRTVEVEVVADSSRGAGLERTTAEWVVFLDGDDHPDDSFVDALARAQAAAGADAVTTAVRPSDDTAGVQLFLGDPGSLGLTANHYGVLGLVRRSLLEADPPPDGAGDPDWPLFARLALAGARILSLPEPLSTHAGRPGRACDIPGDGLAVLCAFEASGADRRDLPQLAATLAAAHARLEAAGLAPADGMEPLVARVLRVAHTQGVGGLVRRAGARLWGHEGR